VELNLRAPLSPKTEAEFRSGSGVELVDHPKRPAKMRALHSSAALAVNFFDYWRDREMTTLAHALGLSGSIKTIKFEAQCPTGLQGNPPNLDLLLEVDPGSYVAIESKFTEAYSHRPAKTPFKRKYFPSDRYLWKEAGLPRCQQLAEAISNDPRRFLHLNAPQLLKHALGVATALKKQSSLLYLYFDHPGEEGDAHREELAKFEAKTGGEAGFRSLSYQAAFAALLPACSSEESEYVQYLAQRYFGERHSAGD